VTLDLAAHGLVAPMSPPRRPAGPGSVAGLLADLVRDEPDKVILVGRGGRLSARELDEAAGRMAGVLRSLGVGPGTRVAASMPNDIHIVVAFLGAMRVGAIWLGINRPLAPPEKAYMLADSQAAVFIGDVAMAGQVREHASALPELARVVVCEPDSPDDELADLLAAADPATPPAIVDPLGPAAIAYTSGTTGFPKGAVHSQHNLLLPGAVAAHRAATAPAVANPVLGVPLPLTILNLMVLGPLSAYQTGTPMVAMDRVDGLGMAEWIHREKITNFAAVPAMVHDLLTHPEVSDEMLSSIAAIGVGGADMPDAFRRLYEERFGRRVGTGYGLTEAPTSVTGEDVTKPPVPGTCGAALPQVKVHILDDDGNELAIGEVGEVCVGPSTDGEFADVYRPMLGYWNKSAETERALRGGLLHTGDIGCLDADGNLFIKDRKNDLIIRGGANVYPAEVERVIHDVDGVAACAVIGVPDERLGEIVVAFVEPMPGRSIDPAAVTAHCAANLARYKVPEAVHVVGAFERTPMGKIKKTVLRDRVASTGA
jgi:acyl-CoA synthetase (AMP-forming)/AMP-acid ligase II